MVVAGSLVEGVAIRYALPVLGMTSCFHVIVLWCVICVSKRRQNATSKQPISGVYVIAFKSCLKTGA